VCLPATETAILSLPRTMGTDIPPCYRGPAQSGSGIDGGVTSAYGPSKELVQNIIEPFKRCITKDILDNDTQVSVVYLIGCGHPYPFSEVSGR